MSRTLVRKRHRRAAHAGVVETAVVPEHAQHLVEVEGIALGQLVQARDQRRRRLPALARATSAPTASRSRPRSGTRCASRIGIGEPARLPLRLALAASRDDEQAGGTQLAGDEREQRERRLVRPVQILEHDEQRRARGGATDEARHRVEQPEPRLGVATRRRGGLDVGAAHPDAGNEVRQDRGVRSQLVAQRVRLGAADVLLERAHPGPVARRARLLGRASPQHPTRRKVGLAHQLLDHPGLADARIPGDDHQPGTAGVRVAQPRRERLQLALAADEQRSSFLAEADHAVCPRTPNLGMAATETWTGALRSATPWRGDAARVPRGG